MGNLAGLAKAQKTLPLGVQGRPQPPATTPCCRPWRWTAKHPIETTYWLQTHRLRSPQQTAAVRVASHGAATASPPLVGGGGAFGRIGGRYRNRKPYCRRTNGADAAQDCLVAFRATRRPIPNAVAARRRPSGKPRRASGCRSRAVQQYFSCRPTVGSRTSPRRRRAAAADSSAQVGFKLIAWLGDYTSCRKLTLGALLFSDRRIDE